MLPNLVVIGAAKCGTTSLHEYLGLHPEIGMSRVKELDFFVAERNWHRGEGWYVRQFPDDRPVRGESSPKYTCDPLFAGVPERMARVIPEAKLVYLVRDPLERLLSAYRFHRYVLRSAVPASIEEAVRAPERSLYVVASRYGHQLERYLEVFAREQILVLDAVDLRARRSETLAEVFRFLGVDDRFAHPGLALDHNVSARSRRIVGRLAVATLNRTLGRARSERLRHRAPSALVRLLYRDARPPQVPLEPALRARLEELLREDAARLRELTGKPFPGWSV